MDLEPPGKARRSGALGDEDGGGGSPPTAQLIADIAYNMDVANKRAEEDKAGKVGTLQSITKDAEFLVLAARGCGRF